VVDSYLVLSAMHCDRLGDVVEQVTAPVSDQNGPDLARRIAHDERGRKSAAETADGTVAMDLSAAGVHHTEVALAVHDLAGQLNFSQILVSLRGESRAAGRQ